MRKYIITKIFIAIMIVTAACTISGCKKNERDWWKDSDNLIVRIYEPLATPYEVVLCLGGAYLIPEITYLYDSQSHMPNTELYYKGELKVAGTKFDLERYNERTDKWEKMNVIKEKGRYFLRMKFFVSPFTSISGEYYEDIAFFVNVVDGIK